MTGGRASGGLAAGTRVAKGTNMRDLSGALGARHRVLAAALGLAMARQAADILDRHRTALAAAAPGGAGAGAAAAADVDDEQFAIDNAIFTAVLDAANECLGEFDARPPSERWCDALLQVIQLAQAARISAAPGRPAPGHPA